MNAKAKALGLTSTHFENPHGLDQAGHVSSARDVTTLLTAALRNPFIRTWSTRSTATIAGGRALTSTDDLIGTLPLVGAKTGHTNDAGWSQVAAVERNGVRITASLLGAASESQRNAELASLAHAGASSSTDRVGRRPAITSTVTPTSATGGLRFALVAPRTSSAAFGSDARSSSASSRARPLRSP